MNWKDEKDETLICFCSRMDKATVVATIQKGANDVKVIQEQTKAGVGGRCKELNPRGRCCHPDIKELLEIYGERK